MLENKFVSVSPLLVPVDKLFDYAIPEHLISKITLGTLVIIPFGKMRIFGIVVSLKSSPEVSITKDVLNVVSDFKPIPIELLSLCKWTAYVYVCPLYSVLEAMFPFQKRLKAIGVTENAYLQLKHRTLLFKTVLLNKKSPLLDNYFEKLKKSPAKRRIIEFLLKENEPLTVSQLIDKSRSSSHTINSLYKEDVIIFEFQEKILQPVFLENSEIESHLDLTNQQKQVLDEIKTDIDTKKYQRFLLYGVPGSGKTEIYMQSAQHCLNNGKRVLMLIPEIALGTQIISRFAKRFSDKLAIWHSSLSFGERLHEWEKIASGKICIVIGARSAVFAPLENIGLIIIDEEHEMAYKQESQPRYHAREVATQRAKNASVPIILGSATPSIESYFLAQKGIYKLLSLTERIGESSMPEITVLDLKKNKAKRTMSVFTQKLLDEVASTLEKQEQSLLYLNHRGYSQYVVCFKCGCSVVCVNCSVTLKYHKQTNLLTCHLCGYSIAPPESCPECESKNLRYYGIGTEKAFNQLQRYFTAARIARMDRDTTQKKGEYGRIIKSLENREIDILVGTQMIAKGLDFPCVTFVGVITADTIINMPDFRASERTFQLLMQVAGRAGRRETKGRVIIQTLYPAHSAIVLAAEQDYNKFYEKEIIIREKARFPPFAKMITFLISDKDSKLVVNTAKEFCEKLKEKIKTENPENRFVDVLGPSEAPIYKISSKYRWFIALRGASLKHILKITRSTLNVMDKKQLKLITVDVSPVSMM